MEAYGIRGLVLKWFKSYLSNRQQFVSIGDNISSHLFTKCGVPQGSILGPLLFIIYINDIVNVSDIAELIMFADDTNIFFSDYDINKLNLTVNVELAKLALWFKLNRLSLNIKKTNFMLFKCRQKNIPVAISIVIDNVNIQQVYSTKFLGVIINQHLSWNDHILAVKGKANKSIGILLKIRKHLPLYSLSMLYNCLIHPYFEYCNIVWGYPSIHLDSLFRTQKKAIRIITNSKWKSHSKPLFDTLSILPLNQLHKFQVGCFVYKSLHNLLPNTFSNYFTLCTQIHHHNTRHSTKLHVFQSRIKIRANSIRISGVNLWNLLNIKIRNAQSFSVFKKI